ncbi:MAG: AI-2E family transporter [Planctomycetota bacterium]
MTQSTREFESKRDGWTSLHLWQIQPLRDVLLIGTIVFLVYLGSKLALVTVPLLLAVLIAYIVEPVIRWLVSFDRVTRTRAALILIVGIGLTIVLPVAVGSVFAVRSAIQFSNNTITNLVTLAEAVDEDASDGPSELSREDARSELPNDAWRSVSDRIIEARDSMTGIEVYGEATEGVQAVEAPWVERAIVESIDQLGVWANENRAVLSGQAIETIAGFAQQIIGIAVSIGSLLFSGFLTAFFFFFICTGWARVTEWFSSLIPNARRDRVLEIAKKMDGAISGFIRGRVTIAIILSILFTIAYSLIGVPAAIVLGLLIGALSVFPYLAIVGVFAAVILMFLDPAEGIRGTWWWILGAPAIVYFVLQTLDEYVLTPKIVGKTTDMDTPTVLFASFAGGALAGIYGLLVAIPIAACLKIVLSEIFWPRVQAWVKGEVVDPLPIDGGRGSSSAQ